MTAREALSGAAARLTQAGVPGAAADARRLLAWALDMPAHRLVGASDTDLSSDAVARFEIAVARRAAREPVSHITGRRLFWGRDFAVDRDVLDPRPETETLIALALDAPYDRVLDLGTGTGCILVTLLAERADAIGTATDVSPQALAHATGNAMRHGVSDRFEAVAADWFRHLGAAALSGRFDLIASNPPYIAADEMPGLSPEVRDHEPHLALTDGADGLSAYRAIAAGVARYLTSGGRVLLEIGPSQGQAVSALLEQAGLGDITVHPDLDGRDRVVSAHG